MVMGCLALRAHSAASRSQSSGNDQSGGRRDPLASPERVFDGLEIFGALTVDTLVSTVSDGSCRLVTRSWLPVHSTEFAGALFSGATFACAISSGAFFSFDTFSV